MRRSPISIDALKVKYRTGRVRRAHKVRAIGASVRL
jgi:hypothetical protein